MQIIQRRNLPNSAWTKEETEKKLIIIHWIVGTKWAGIRTFENPRSTRSSHYIIAADGEITQLVDEKYISHAAGYSVLDGYSTFGPYRGKVVDWHSLNPCSINIECAGPPSIVNQALYGIGKKPTMEEGWPEQEMNALADLCKDIATRWTDIRLTDHSSVVARFDRKTKKFLKDADGNYIRTGKIDVRKGTGKKIDIFPWDWLIENTGIQEA